MAYEILESEYRGLVAAVQDFEESHRRIMSQQDVLDMFQELVTTIERAHAEFTAAMQRPETMTKRQESTFRRDLNRFGGAFRAYALVDALPPRD